MSAKIQPEWVERRANTDPETGARQKRLLVIGVNAAQMAAAFARLMPNCHIEAAARADHAVLAMASGHFDATLVDCRDDERFHRLAVVAARQFKQGRVALLASDHFLPDENAVFDNLDIFGSGDDSAKLLASLQLKAKMPAKRKAAPESADFETALRAELEALQNRTGRSGPEPGAETSPAAKNAAPAPEPEAMQTSASVLNLPQQYIENSAQSLIVESADFLADLASELEEALLFETVPAVTAISETDFATPPDPTGDRDLFGHPRTGWEDFALPQYFEPIVETSDFSDDLDLFSYLPAAPVNAKSSPAAPVNDGKRNLDLFGFSITEADEIPQLGPAHEAGNTAPFDASFLSHPDLFGALASALQKAEPIQAVLETSEELDFFASVRSGLRAIHRSQARSENLPAMDNEAAAADQAVRFPIPEAVPRAGQPGLGENPPHISPPIIKELADPTTKNSLLRSTSWLAHLLPRLTALCSIIYKSLALVLLGALFTAIVAFGVTIAFLLTSNRWSAPITLSRGHELVVKVERELSELNVRKNQISEQIDDAEKNWRFSQDELSSAHTLAGIIEGTIIAEIKNRSEIRTKIEKHNEALRNVAAQYGNDPLIPGYEGNLVREFDRWLINRNVFEAGKLARLEAAHRTALIRNEIAANGVEISRLNATLAALHALSGQVDGTPAPIVDVGAADLAPLLNQVVEVRRAASEAASELKAAESQKALLSDSLESVESSITRIQSTPLARAISENFAVLFVPYENAGQYENGDSLYSCAFGIFFCSEAGRVGKVIKGETIATHPFFNRPVRGSLVEADLTDLGAAAKEMLHVKRRPLFF
jgi:hypothetical protein